MPAAPGSVAANPLQPLTLLLVEDDFLLARGMRAQLTRLGYVVTGLAATAAEAEALFRADPPDLVLLDVHLADATDGITLAGRLLAYQPVPLVFLTSDQDPETFARARLLGPFAFLPKPFEGPVLGHAIELAAQHFAARYPRTEADALSSLPNPAPPADAAPPLVREAFWVREGSRLVRVAVTELIWLEADSNYCHLHTLTGRKLTVRATLREMEARLPAAEFARVHRSHTVRVAAIESLDPARQTLTLREGSILPLGPSYRDTLVGRLETL